MIGVQHAFYLPFPFVSAAIIGIFVAFGSFVACKIMAVESPLDVLHIYYINLDEAEERRKQFETKIDLLPHHVRTALRVRRVSAFTNSDIKSMLKNRTFILNELHQLFHKEVDYEWWERKYSFEEAACTLSHLKAIMQAYDEGLEYSLIVEDDAILTIEFLEKWRSYAEAAPQDWMILQWTTSNPSIAKKEVHKDSDFWLSWTAEHWSTIAYTIRRDGMKRLINRTSNTFWGEGSEHFFWKFSEPRMLRADELIYFLAGNAYTSSHCWVRPFRSNSTIRSSHIPWHHFYQSEHKPNIGKWKGTNRPESIAVLESMRLNSVEEIHDELKILNADVQSLACENPRSRWFVKVVLTDSSFLRPFEAMSSPLLAKHVHFQVEISKDRFNKFLLVYENLEELSKYDFLLLKDNDIRLSGFPWNTFLNRSNSSVISGPFRIKIEDTTDRHKKILHDCQRSHSVHVNLQDGALFNTRHEDNFHYKHSHPVMTLEEFMVLIRTDFAVWFFKRALTTHFLSQDIDWGPDLMWCGAAHQFLVKHDVGQDFTPCSLHPLNIVDIDTKQIFQAKEEESFHAYVERGNHVVTTFKKNPVFDLWIEGSNRPILNFSSLKKWCRANFISTRPISNCLEKYHQSRVEDFSRLKTVTV